MSQFAHPRGCILWFNLATLEGDRVYEQSGYENHGTIYGAAWRRGPIGGMLSFDGVDDYVEVPYASELDAPSELTLEVLLKLDVVKDLMLLVGNGGGWGADGYHLMTYPDRIRFELQNTTTGEKTILDTISKYEVGEWFQIVGLWKSPTVSLYWNGEFDREGSFVGPIGTQANPVRVGWQNYGPTYLDGSIALVRIYNRALSADEISAHYHYYLTRLKEG